MSNGEHIFSVRNKVEKISDHLKNDDVPEELINKFSQEGQLLSKSELSLWGLESGNSWGLYDVEKNEGYRVVEENGILNIYTMDEKRAKNFRRLDLPPLIETSEVNFGKEFYNPVLKLANSYKRGVGFFTSGWFKLVSSGIEGLVKNEGTAKWIISPILEKEDWNAFKKGEKGKRDKIIYNSLEKNVENLKEELEKDTLNTIAWMISDNLLKIKFAEPQKSLSGDFHDKWGVVEDFDGNKIAFHGSQNDSKKGFTDFDSFDIFCDWLSKREAQRVFRHEKRFDKIWNNEKKNLEVKSLPQGIKENICELRDREKRPYAKPDNSLWRHQLEAIEEFMKVENGILEMATGTGKTRTALEILERLIEKEKISGMIVSTCGKDLLGQWFEDLLDFFDSESLLIYEDYGSEKETVNFISHNDSSFPIFT